MNLPTSEPLPPEEPASLPPARLRRSRRLIVPRSADARVRFVNELAERVIPSADFFLFSLLTGLLVGAAILLDSPALFVLAALLAPFMAPAIGLALATIVGSVRTFLQALGGMVTGSLLVFGGGCLAGWLAQLWPGMTFPQASQHAYFSWPDFLLLTLGAGLTTFLLVRAPQQRPLVTSVALAYELYLPLSVAGFGLTSANNLLWPSGLVVFTINLAWAALIGTLVLAALGLRPLTLFGYTLGTTLLLLSVAAIIIVVGFSTVATVPPPNLPGVRVMATATQPPASPTASPLPTTAPSSTRAAAVSAVDAPSQTPTPKSTPKGGTQPPTGTPTNTLVPSRTPTITVTTQPTLAWARINAGEFSGALIRAEPNPSSKVVKSLLNGNVVQVLPETERSGNIIWLHVRTADGTEGWIVRNLLEINTPVPGW